ncbi:acetyl-CoA C-acyltransferase family protein [Croceicoccus naphthovorans]|uniref:Acetyl-CoA acetyltransferase n=1 Tax=Croceicoccus naphthovorans TaxID=1348774 RepID=A0A0G3XIS2_9SPHN|nr:acetyl-CoA C-acyltransferase family protein [Croceicoccus naphthovorans]AKM10248.1 acetyl-CoA acetyltransferase [Croceicoccus naphthovorans]MBB3992011.1 acetyl-CoA C-acetyltransferase [Croceicoccus naphthovorans]
MNAVYLVSAARTAVGTFGGSLKDANPGSLGAVAIKGALARAGVSPELVEHTILGSVIPCEPRDAYVSRIAAVEAGIPHGAPAMTVNRLCGSGMQAIVSAAQHLMLGDHAIAVGGGAEVMSRAPYFAMGVRWGLKMGDSPMMDGMLGALQDPFHRYHMGITAENVAEKYEITREQQDAFAAESHRRAAAAIEAGYFKDQIEPVEIMVKRKPAMFEVDEHVKAGTTAEGLAGLRPVFKKDGGTVTAGNASGINDGAGAVVLATEAAVKEHGLKPMARLVSYGHAGVDPAYMGIGPVPASQIAIEKSGLSKDQLDVIESNEAFAAQACAVSKQLDLDPAKVNPNGSGISLGHPIGGTGAIIVTKLAYELQRTGGKYGLATMCIGGGQGIATVWENLA